MKRCPYPVTGNTVQFEANAWRNHTTCSVHSKITSGRPISDKVIVYVALAT